MTVLMSEKIWDHLRDEVARLLKESCVSPGKISAGYLRSMGIPVSEDIPDCAVVPANAVHFDVESDKDDEKEAQGIVSVKINCVVDEPWEWIEFKASLSGGSE